VRISYVCRCLLGFYVCFEFVVGFLPIIHKLTIYSAILRLNQSWLDKVLAEGVGI